ncbi:FxsA family protein [Sporolactobacillus shoreae]|uniref:FxsA family protein n=1 Tax=Sporolactobacillus shoreae TaxID=1465501 RepID=A0A4Z0GR47_9BACL|nr:FxsA family protein [Sporolactobacillus shoreae]TGA99264.1 FxsA family protein [Sporolactobacillus shoreae]
MNRYWVEWSRKFWIWFLIYVLAEISLLIWVGRQFGVLNTLLLLLISAILGIWTVRKQGFSILQKIRDDLSERRIPGNPLLDGLCLILGGFLFVIPGFISDAAGLLLLIPRLRVCMRKKFIIWIQNRISQGNDTFIFFRKRI